MKRFVLWIIVFLMAAVSSAQVKIGIAKKNITPSERIWLSGYAARNRPSEGILQDIWAKAVVIEGKKNSRLVLLTTDLIGFTHELSVSVIDSITKKYGLERSQLVINSSHTHSGPVIWPGLAVMYNLNDSDLFALIRYNRKLKKDLVELVGEAMDNMTEGYIFAGHGTADFAINRRQQNASGVSIGLNPDGPVDHDVPVVKFTTTDGRLLAILFGYACHNTTLDGYEICGDYAGFAQSYIEEYFPGTVAMFMQGCGADQNPNPRRTVESAKAHGQTLGASVIKVLDGDLKPVRFPVKTAYQTVKLDFKNFDPEKYLNEISDKNMYKRNRAEFLLQAYDRGYIPASVTYPVQAVRFGRDLTIVALGGEVVVDYSLKTKERYPSENLFVAGYCTEVPCYIPSLRILHEGGYEPDESMIYYGLPGPFKDDVEERISSAIDKVLKKTGSRK